MLPAVVEGLRSVITRRAERCLGFVVERDVEMDAPLLGVAALLMGGDAVRQVGVTRQASVRVALDDLMQVGRFIEAAGRLDGAFPPRVESECCGKMDLGNPQTLAMQYCQRSIRVLVFEREVAAVVVDADASLDLLVVLGVLQQAVVETQGFLGVLEVPEWLGLEAEMQVALGHVRKSIEESGKLDQVSTNDLLVGVEGLEGAGQGGDRSAHAFRSQLRHDREKLLGVLHSGRGGPVRLIDFLLHPGAMEVAVRETVDREDVGILGNQPILESGELVTLKQLSGGLSRQAKSDGVGLVSAANEIAHGQRVGSQDRAGLIPRLGGMDVRAVGEVTAGKSHGAE